MNKPFVSYAQHGEDVVLWRALRERGSCFYVDVGAYDPTEDSVTRALYERGWRGINIEAQPDRITPFLRDRPDDINVAVAIGDEDGTAVLAIPPVAGWASIVPGATRNEWGETRSVEVPVRRLDSLFSQLGVTRVDVLKIDVEGGEPAAVRGLLGGAVRPTVCVVEGVAPGLGRAAGDEAVDLLVRAGYLHCMFDGLNHYLTTDTALVDALSVPANPNDGYVSMAVETLSSERERLVTVVARLAEENLELRNPLARVEQREATDADPARSSLTAPAPVPAAVAAPSSVETSAAVRVEHEEREPLVDASERRRRRRGTFTRMLVDASRGHGEAGSRDKGVLPFAFSDLTGRDLVDALYKEILGREADVTGRESWVSALENGGSAVGIARALAYSAESLNLPARRRARVREDVRLWSAYLAVSEMGLARWYTSEEGYTPGRVRHEVFVRALYEAALGRTPTAAELDLEVGKLVAGVGREWLLSAFAARPEVVGMLRGAPGGRLRRRLARRGVRSELRSMVELAEARQMDALLQDVLPHRDLIDRARRQAQDEGDD